MKLENLVFAIEEIYAADADAEAIILAEREPPGRLFASPQVLQRFIDESPDGEKDDAVWACGQVHGLWEISRIRAGEIGVVVYAQLPECDLAIGPVDTPRAQPS